MMENQANAAPAADPSEPKGMDHEAASAHGTERFLMPPKEFVRLTYLISGAVMVLLSLAIWLMMSLA
ncbi:MAG: hypothetical protein ACKO65_10840 [Betaproteobacteria bacterium]